jgi:hypothetical protein
MKDLAAAWLVGRVQARDYEISRDLEAGEVRYFRFLLEVPTKNPMKPDVVAGDVRVYCTGKLAKSACQRVRRGDTVLVEGSLQTRWLANDGSVEVRAKRLQVKGGRRHAERSL